VQLQNLLKLVFGAMLLQELPAQISSAKVVELDKCTLSRAISGIHLGINYF
jgi:hypothetical protein